MIKSSLPGSVRSSSPATINTMSGLRSPNHEVRRNSTPAAPKQKWTWGRIKRALEVKGYNDTLNNVDLLPTLPDRHVWNWVAFFCYWFSESWAIATWSLGASMISIGMTVAESIILVFFGNLILSIACVVNSRAAAVYHVGFPVLARAAFGMYAHYFFVVLRAILGIIWGGVQLYFEGQFISIMLRCIFSGWWKMRNTIPESQDITLQTLLGFLFAFLVTVPILFVHTYKLRHLFTIKSFCLPLAGLGIVIWAAVENGGIDTGVIVDTSVRNSRTAFAFAVLSQLNGVFGASSALVVTIPDLARYATTPNSQLWGQVFGLPVAQTICASFGILTTAAIKQSWGQLYWNPYDLLNAILDHYYTPGGRAGVFFAALSFAFATLGTSIACNIIPFAADVTSLAPKYINIVRGQLICLVVAFAIVPWRILTSAETFLTFLGGYSIFQGSVVGIMSVDYWLLRKGNLEIRELYTMDRDGSYFYWNGINWRAIAAFIVGFSLPFPGFCALLANAPIAEGAIQMYYLGWLLSISTGALSYYIFGLVFPMPKIDRSDSFEERAKDLEMEVAELDYGFDTNLQPVYSHDEEKIY